MNDQNSDQVGQITRISQLLRKAGHEPDDAVELTELIGNMASANITARLESKIDNRFDSQDAKIDAQNSKYNVLIWAIGFAGLVISAAILFSDKV